MVYSSLLFIYGFLPVSLLLYYITPKKLREMALLFLSGAFCCLISLYFFIFVVAFAAVNYIFMHLISLSRRNEKVAAVPLAAGIIIDLIAVFAFRTEYFTWLHRMIRAPGSFYPVGISFFALGAIGTLIDVYKGRIKADRNMVRFALYIMFFPRLIMGPLLRYRVFTNILNNRRETLSGMGVGMTVFVKGLAKKVIAADNLYMLYTAAFSTSVKEISALTAWLGAAAYILCLYFVLSGFADMGTGIAYLYGLKFPQSFNYPLLSIRLRYFAARWQSQVTQWLRRYITKPIYSVCRKRWMREAVFVLGWGLFGFWYTVDLNGIIWGVIIGTAVIIESRFLRKKIMNPTGIIYTFLTVIIAGVFLSSDSAGYSVSYLFAMVGGNGAIADTQGFYLFKSYIVLLLVTMYASTDLFRNLMTRSERNRVRTAIMAVSPVLILAVLIVCTALMSYSGSSDMLLMKL
ncbi:hypothetical protein [Ruminococcus flavefaciens]|uniref:hypothetical protein n=1 Tax=Ruminococcus flavefaciens TaxID=1265 RepID=UPI00048D7608|nr:hypothetical protein [Ruminococcus flavefaciens]